MYLLEFRALQHMYVIHTYYILCIRGYYYKDLVCTTTEAQAQRSQMKVQ